MEPRLKLFQVKDGESFQRSVSRRKSGPFCGKKRDNNTSWKEQVSKHFNVFLLAQCFSSKTSPFLFCFFFLLFTQGFSSITFLYHLSLSPFFVYFTCVLTTWLVDWRNGRVCERKIRGRCKSYVFRFTFLSVPLSLLSVNQHLRNRIKVLLFFSFIFRSIVSKLTPNEQRSVT